MTNEDKLADAIGDIVTHHHQSNESAGSNPDYSVVAAYLGALEVINSATSEVELGLVKNLSVVLQRREEKAAKAIMSSLLQKFNKEVPLETFYDLEKTNAAFKKIQMSTNNVDVLIKSALTELVLLTMISHRKKPEEFVADITETFGIQKVAGSNRSVVNELSNAIWWYGLFLLSSHVKNNFFLCVRYNMSIISNALPVSV